MIGTKLYLARTDNHTHLQWNIPVIFLPGVMGSRLRFPGRDYRWDPDDRGAMKHWLFEDVSTMRLQLHHVNQANVMTDRTKEPLQPNEQGLGWEGVAWSFYVPFLRFLHRTRFQLAECSIHAVGYDWRRDINLIATNVAQRVQQILDQAKADHFLLVTHSMGGLVARAMLKKNAALADKLLGVVHVVQPANGAVVAYRRFFTGAVSDLDGGWRFSCIIGNTAEKYACIISGLPGPMQLLPNNRYADRDRRPWLQYVENGVPSSWTGNIYSHYKNPLSPPGLIEHRAYDRGDRIPIRDDIAARITAAEQFHNWLGDYKHPRTHAIFSTGVVSDMAIRFNPATRPQTGKWENRGANPIRRNQGDGTVPDTSANALYPTQTDPSRQLSRNPLETCPKQCRVDNVEHAEAFNDNEIRARIVNMIQRILFESMDRREPIK